MNEPKPNNVSRSTETPSPLDWGARETEIRLAEYNAAQDMLKHYDSLNWQIGAILIGGILVFSGVVINTDLIGLMARQPRAAYQILVLVPLLSLLVLGCWLLWFERHRALYNLRNETMHRIEAQLGMYHHLRASEAALKIKSASQQEVLTRARSSSGHAKYPLLQREQKLPWVKGHWIPRILLLLIPLWQGIAIYVLASAPAKGSDAVADSASPVPAR